jgi:hypothetical protein
MMQTKGFCDSFRWWPVQDHRWQDFFWCEIFKPEKIMKNFVIRYEPTDKHSVLNLVRNFSNDITIDKVEEDRVGITIELDDEEADEMYSELSEEVREMTDVRQRHYTGD